MMKKHLFCYFFIVCGAIGLCNSICAMHGGRDHDEQDRARQQQLILRIYNDLRALAPSNAENALKKIQLSIASLSEDVQKSIEEDLKKRGLAICSDIIWNKEEDEGEAKEIRFGGLILRYKPNDKYLWHLRTKIYDDYRVEAYETDLTAFSWGQLLQKIAGLMQASPYQKKLEQKGGFYLLNEAFSEKRVKVVKEQERRLSSSS